MKIDKKIKTILISFMLIGSILGACNFSGAEDDEEPIESIQEQEEVDQPEEAPFEELSAEEFFEMCELAGGQVEQWGSSWACDFEEKQDITCNGAGECNFGTVPEIVTAGYSIKPPALAAEDDPGDFVGRCSEAGGVFFKWHAGFGCDFEDRMDVICVPEEDGECGLGWVTKPTDLVPDEDVETPPEGEGGGLVLVAQVLKPAFQQDEMVIKDQPPGDPGNEFVLPKQFLSTDIFTAPASSTDNNVAKADDSDDGGEDDEEGDMCDDKTDTTFECKSLVYEIWGNLCEIEGGTPTYWDQSQDEYFVVCENPDGGDDWKCDRLKCEGYEAPLLDFGGFQEAFQATQVFILLAGPSDIDQGFLDPAQPGNDLYIAIVEMNGIMGEVEGQSGVFAPINLPGTVSIIAPNNVVFQSEGPQELLLKPNQSGDQLKEKICGILTPPLCWPDGGLLIPAETLVYFVSVSDLGMPEQFAWSEVVVIGTPDILDPTATFAPEEIIGASATPVPQSTSVEATQKPKATKTSKPPTATDVPPTATATTAAPTNTPIPPDPMNAKISGKTWNDVNGNGAMNSGEGGLAQTSVKIGTGSCNSTGLSSIITSFSGTYSLTGLAAGTYCVSATRTTGCGLVASPTTSTNVTVVLSAGQTITVNFGFQKIIC